MNLIGVFPSHRQDRSTLALKEFVPHAHRLAHHLALGAARSSADLALQPCLGLLPNWRTGNPPDYRDYSHVVVA